MFHEDGMKTVAVRDIRQRWPVVEEALQREGELCVTRDGKPVAKLVRFDVRPRRRRRFDPVEHGKWLRRTWGGRVIEVVDASLAAERADD